MKENCWHRDLMVAGTLCSSVVARMNIRCSGGSSRIFSRALKAGVDSMCTSSTMYTRLRTAAGVYTASSRTEGADLVHAVVGGGVQLQHVQDGPVLNAQTGGTLVAGVAVHRVLTVHRPGQNLGAGGLAGAPGAGKEVGVGQPPGGHLALEGLGDVVLPHHVVKGAGPPFAV